MRTDDLIVELSSSLQPVRKAAVIGTLAVGLAVGTVGSVVLMLATIGLRHDLVVAMSGGAFWMKFGYTLAIASLGLWIVERLGRPGTEVTRPLVLLALPV